MNTTMATTLLWNTSTTQLSSIMADPNTTLPAHESGFCHLHHHHDNYEVGKFIIILTGIGKFIITLCVNVGGTIITILSIIFASLNNAIDPSLRGILLSFSLANFSGTLMLLYDTIMTICYKNRTRIGVVINISISLTMSHMMFLLLAEYLILTSVVRRSVKDFSALLIIAWMISICVGSTLVITTNTEGRIVFVAILVCIIIFMGIGFVSILQKSQRRFRCLEQYEKKYLNLNHHKSRVVKRYWKLKYYAIILASYVVCACPWVIEEIYTRLNTHAWDGTLKLMKSVPLIIYACNFYFPSVIIIYLWVKKYKAKKRVLKLYAFAEKSIMLGLRMNEVRRIHDSVV